MSTKLRAEAKNDFKKYFFKLMNNAVFGKTMKNVRKHRDIKLGATDKRSNELVSEPNYDTATYFSEDLLAIEIKKPKLKMNKSVYWSMSILKISKTLIYEFWFDYIKPKYQSNGKLCCMDTDSFIIHTKIDASFEHIANDVKKWCDTWNYSENDKRPLSRGMNKKIIGLMEDELGRIDYDRIMIEFDYDRIYCS